MRRWMMRVTIGAVCLMVTGAGAQDRPRDAEGGHPMDRLHERHTHQRNADHPAAFDGSRFATSRRSPVKLPLPMDDEAFFFVVYGDRTGGPDEGVAVLKDAVRDTNLLEPDLVMTVGDMIQGYNQTDEWMEEMGEFKGVMDELICPWFPVAGNHDVYWRGPGKPTGEHEKSYELHFGPLWYAFEHKNCLFIALYSDEGDPATGLKSIHEPASQVMSDEQLGWLRETLAGAAGMDHVFVFLHHPRWRGANYGDDWMTRVHPELVKAGNVSAVFAGHIHRMKYREADGIEYFTLATVGGHNDFEVPRAGNLHHFNVVTVRKNQIASAAIPVGEALDPRELTEDFTLDAARLARLRPELQDPAIVVHADGSAEGTIAGSLTNPVDHPIDVMLSYASEDSRWIATPDHVHKRLGPGETLSFRMDVLRVAGAPDRTYRPIELTVATDLLTPAFRYQIPASSVEAPTDVSAAMAATAAASGGDDYAAATGAGSAVVVDSGSFELPDGPFTLECWFKAERLDGRTGLLAKTEGSAYGLFVSDGQPHFAVHLDGGYKVCEGERGDITPGAWHHIAGVFDGEEVRVYLDGDLIDGRPASGRRTPNDLPLVIGGDVDRAGSPTSVFDGRVDGVRLSSVARYRGARYDPPARYAEDSDTVLLVDFDAALGPNVLDRSRSNATVRVQKGASLVPAVK